MLEAEKHRSFFTQQQRSPLQYTDGNPAVTNARLARFELVQAGLAALDAMHGKEGNTGSGEAEPTRGDPALPAS